MKVKKNVKKWVRRAGIWLYLKYATGKQHINRIRNERSHDSVHIHSAHVRLYSNVEKKILYTMDMTQNFISNWKRRGMYMRSPHDPSVDGVFMKWRPEMTLAGCMDRFPVICPEQHTVYLKVEYSFIKKHMEEEEDGATTMSAAVYMIHPQAQQEQPYYYFPPYSITTATEQYDSGAAYWLGPAIPTACDLSTFHRWPDPWMQAETIIMTDQQKKTS